MIENDHDTMNPHEASLYSGEVKPSNDDWRVIRGLPLGLEKTEQPAEDSRPMPTPEATETSEINTSAEQVASRAIKKQRPGQRNNPRSRSVDDRRRADIGRAHAEQGIVHLGHDPIEPR